jgi:hypothetical protein
MKNPNLEMHHIDGSSIRLTTKLTIVISVQQANEYQLQLQHLKLSKVRDILQYKARKCGQKYNKNWSVIRVQILRCDLTRLYQAADQEEEQRRSRSGSKVGATKRWLAVSAADTQPQKAHQQDDSRRYFLLSCNEAY